MHPNHDKAMMKPRLDQGPWSFRYFASLRP